MSTSEVMRATAVRERLVHESLTGARRYAVATVLCAVFSVVYEHFSHEVISWWMVGLGAWPLVLGVLPNLVCAARAVFVPDGTRQLWACGVMTLAAGSCLRGVLEIYGTTSALVAPYLPVGAALLGLALLPLLAVRWIRARAA